MVASNDSRVLILISVLDGVPIVDQLSEIHGGGREKKLINEVKINPGDNNRI